MTPVPTLLLAIGSLAVSAHAGEACPPASYMREQLLEIKQADFVIEDARKRNALAIALLACVGDPDPAIRDGVVFEGLSTWLRGQSLAPETINTVYANLAGQISSTADGNGFQQPFAALILSEVARTDRVDNTLSEPTSCGMAG